MSVLRERKLNEKIHSFQFESFGVKIVVQTSRERYLDKILGGLKKDIPVNFKLIENKSVNHKFFVEYTKDKTYRFKKDGELIFEDNSEENFFAYLSKDIKLTVIENAVGKVFLHAGVVGWKSQALILPARSFQGKTTIVKELVKNGAEYFSDDSAVLDANGFVSPFPKTLSVRNLDGGFEQFERTVESFGGRVAAGAMPVSMVLMTWFEKDAEWNPVVLRSGQGIMEIIPHTIPIRNNPKFSLQVLNKVASRAIICKSSRGEADKFAPKILEFFEQHI